mmetsp:Transcript_2398/g.7326  ORF Transcript_2398/g.7326 Transcript_2398/m.7326 type:complete len:565 (+) Transcript_2398:1536-3230(+)
MERSMILAVARALALPVSRRACMQAQVNSVAAPEQQVRPRGTRAAKTIRQSRAEGKAGNTRSIYQSKGYSLRIRDVHVLVEGLEEADNASDVVSATPHESLATDALRREAALLGGAVDKLDRVRVGDSVPDAIRRHDEEVVTVEGVDVKLLHLGLGRDAIGLHGSVANGTRDLNVALDALLAVARGRDGAASGTNALLLGRAGRGVVVAEANGQVLARENCTAVTSVGDEHTEAVRGVGVVRVPDDNGHGSAPRLIGRRALAECLVSLDEGGLDARRALRLVGHGVLGQGSADGGGKVAVGKLRAGRAAVAIKDGDNTELAIPLPERKVLDGMAVLHLVGTTAARGGESANGDLGVELDRLADGAGAGVVGLPLRFHKVHVDRDRGHVMDLIALVGGLLWGDRCDDGRLDAGGLLVGLVHDGLGEFSAHGGVEAELGDDLLEARDHLGSRGALCGLVVPHLADEVDELNGHAGLFRDGDEARAEGLGGDSYNEGVVRIGGVHDGVHVRVLLFDALVRRLAGEELGEGHAKAVNVGGEHRGLVAQNLGSGVAEGGPVEVALKEAA